MEKRILFILLICLPAVLDAQPALQDPARFLGYELGERFTPHHRVLAYSEHVADRSDRVTLHRYGTSYEHRELFYLVITTPDNHRNIEVIRQNNLRLAGLANGIPEGPMRALVWLSYNVHGNEPSPSEAAMKTLFELADPSHEESGSWLGNTVVILDPMLNPDGRERYVSWYTRMEGIEANPLPAAREHHEEWPGGRSNHYYADLNRDWAWQVQQETKFRTQAYLEWMPHIHVDFHEQEYTSPYYFAPAAEPFHDAITEWQREFQTTIGRHHTGIFDERGWLYFTRQRFDLFYPGFGDTWPTFNGAIGMTYEQAGHGMAGRSIFLPEGDTLTLADRLSAHHVTGMSTIEITSLHADRVVDEFRNHFQKATTSPAGTYMTYLVKAENHPDRIYSLLNFLDDQNIRYGVAGIARDLHGYNYSTGETGPMRIEEEDILITARQPQSQLVRVLFEPQPVLTDSLTYDITAWEAHYRYGLTGYALENIVEPEIDISADRFRLFSDTGSDAEPYAYIIPWNSMDDARFLAEIMQNGVKARYTLEPFTLNGESYDRGTLVITRAGNESAEQFDRIVTDTARQHARRLHRSGTGHVTTGPDFGSADVKLIEPPRIALLAGEGTSSTSTGEVWHFLDRQLHYPATLLGTGRILQTDLGLFDVLIMPSGNYKDILNEEIAEKLKIWVRNGGRLIAIGEANKSLSDIEWITLSYNLAEKPANGDQLRRFSERERYTLETRTQGSVFSIHLDTSHPLAFGYGEEYFSLRLTSKSFPYLENAWNVGVAGQNSHRSGFIGHEARTALENTLVFGVQNVDRGSVTYLIDNPLFRGFWENGKLLFVNSLFFSAHNH